MVFLPWVVFGLFTLPPTMIRLFAEHSRHYLLRLLGLFAANPADGREEAQGRA